MAPVSPPSYLQAGSYDAVRDRQVLSALMTPAADVGATAGRAGVKPFSTHIQLKVGQRATPDMWVTVQSGTAYIQTTSTTGGTYICRNDASYDVQIAAAHATLPRKDLIVARVYDSIDGGGASDEFTIERIAGTPASTPARPATPSQSIALAEVHVAAGDTSITDADITDLRARTVALGGILPVGSSGEVPASPYAAQAIWRADLAPAELRIYNGTAWTTIFAGDSPVRPFASLGRATHFPIPTTTNTALPWTTEREDTHNGHSTSTNTTRYTCQMAGVYQVSVAIPWELTTQVAKFETWFRVNGVTEYVGAVGVKESNNITIVISNSRTIRLALGDYIEVIVWQNSGVTLDVDALHHGGCAFDIIRLRD
jgi:hypothetical protein